MLFRSNCDGTIDENACITVSNVDPALIDAGTDPLTVTVPTTIHTDTGEITGVRGAGTGLVDGIWFEVVPGSGGAPDMGLFASNGLDIASGATVTVVGANTLVLLSSGDATVSGTLDLGGSDGTDALTTAGPPAGGAGTAGEIGRAHV